jgi:hypothetical protein
LTNITHPNDNNVSEQKDMMEEKELGPDDHKIVLTIAEEDDN